MKRILLLMILFICTSNFLLAQVTTSSLSGRILDLQNQPLIGASIEAIHMPTNSSYGILTDEEGNFYLSNVRSGGPYKIVVSYIGYKTWEYEGLNLRLGENSVINATLAEDSKLLEEVTVIYEKNALINSEKNGTSTNISQKQLSTLPTMSRSLNDFLRLTPQSRGSSVASTAGAGVSFSGQDSRYNNLTIDGTIFNNNFGLASANGGQTNSTPISLDALEEIQVNIAPYNVRQSGFTGAGVNAVTRSGTNTLSGSVFYNTRNQNMTGSKADSIKIVKNDFKVNQLGFRLGGPLVKDKLFFFLNFELEQRDDPASSYIAFRDSVSTPLSNTNVSRVKAADLEALSQFLQQKYNYNPGRYEGYALETRSHKGLIKLDYNFSQKHKASFRFNYLKSNRDVLSSNSGVASGNRTPSLTALNFEASNYIINNDIYSGILELNSMLTRKISNQFQIGYTANRDYRGSRGGIFPLVDIQEVGRTYTTFGYEPFTPNNILNSNTFQIKDDIIYSLNKHTITAGINFESFKFENTFTPQFYGQYVFGSLNDFYSAARGDSVGLVRYVQTYSALENRALPTSITKVHMPGIYIQDEFNLLENRLKLTAGLRLDVPIFEKTALKNPEVNSMAFRGANGQTEYYSTDKLPNPQYMFSPRLGFNFDVLGDGKVRIRGGSGLFTGRPPFVWISNQVGNNGILTGQTFVNATNTKAFPFSNDVTKNIPANATTPATYGLAVTSSDFKFPQLWRNNIAVDAKLPWGLVGTLEYIFSKNINQIMYENVNLENSPGNFSGSDNRPYYSGIGLSGNNQNNANRIVDKITDAIALKNTDLGFSQSFTAKLEKQFNAGFYVMAAYNYAQAKDLITGGSIAASSWRDNRSVNGNNRPDLAYSDFDQKHRVIGALSWKSNYSEITSTTVSFFVQSGNQSRISYTYLGDYNGDQISQNDLMYIPKDASEIEFRELKRTFTNPDGTTQTVTVTKQQQAAALNDLINGDKFLSSKRGEYLGRNEYLLGWLTTVDLSLIQDFTLKIGEKGYKLEVRADVYNLLNMFNSKLGVGDYIADINFLKAFNSKDVNGKPVLEFGSINTDTRNYDYTKKLERKSATLSDVWQAQLGVRFSF